MATGEEPQPLVEALNDILLSNAAEKDSEDAEKWERVVKRIKKKTKTIIQRARMIEAEKEGLLSVFRSLESTGFVKTEETEEVMKTLKGILVQVDNLREETQDIAFKEAICYINSKQTCIESNIEEAMQCTNSLLGACNATEDNTPDGMDVDFHGIISRCLDEDRKMLLKQLQIWKETINFMDVEFVPESTKKEPGVRVKDHFKNIYAALNPDSNEDMDDLGADKNDSDSDIIPDSEVNDFHKPSVKKEPVISDSDSDIVPTKRRRWRNSSDEELKKKKKKKKRKYKRYKRIRKSDPSVTFSCDFCQNVYSSVTALNKHVKTKHGDQGEFKCETCNKTYSFAGALEIHNKSETHLKRISKIVYMDPETNMFPCKVCNNEFKSAEYLKSHVERVHTRAGKYKCDQCDKSFYNKSRLDNHKDLHLPYKRHRCKLCGRAFQQKSALDFHRHSHESTDKKFHCDQCSRMFPTKTRLANHLKLIHRISNAHECEICGRRFLQYASLINHKVTHTSEYQSKKIAENTCYECNKSFKTTFELKKHLQCGIHNPKKDFCCDTCGNKYRSITGLKEHQRRHTGERPFKCDQCPKAFFTHNHLKKHRDIHLDYKPYMCQICSKSFQQKSGLEGHQRVHQEKVFEHTCPICSKVYGSAYSLRHHVKYVHEKEKTHVCPVCGAQYKFNFQLQAHLQIHTGVPPKQYQCQTCGEHFKSTTTLRRHQIIHTGEKKHKCHICAKAFGTAYNLKRHLSSHDGGTARSKPPTVNQQQPAQHQQQQPTQALQQPAVVQVQIPQPVVVNAQQGQIPQQAQVIPQQLQPQQQQQAQQQQAQQPQVVSMPIQIPSSLADSATYSIVTSQQSLPAHSMTPQLYSIPAHTGIPAHLGIPTHSMPSQLAPVAHDPQANHQPQIQQQIGQQHAGMPLQAHQTVSQAHLSVPPHLQAILYPGIPYQ